MITADPLQKGKPARIETFISPVPGCPDTRLTLGRVHEACGPARQRLALWLAAQRNGTVLWISPSWHPLQLAPAGIASMMNPGRILFISCNHTKDILWCTEEALRSGAIALVISDLSELPNLTAVRRMHLAAEQASKTQENTPLGLLLTPEIGGAPGVETRWHLTPEHTPHQNTWRLDRLRARTAPHCSWTLRMPPGAQYPAIHPASNSSSRKTAI